jgi:hypothetical protein
MDVKNKVDENVDENVVKKDKPKPDLSLEVGKLVGYYEGISDSKKDAENARTVGMAHRRWRDGYRLYNWLWLYDYFIEQTS